MIYNFALAQLSSARFPFIIRVTGQAPPRTTMNFNNTVYSYIVFNVKFCNVFINIPRKTPYTQAQKHLCAQKQRHCDF